MFYWSEGRIYEGGWKNGKQHGIGTYTSANNQKRKGEWKDGKRQGWIESGSRFDDDTTKY